VWGAGWVEGSDQLDDARRVEEEAREHHRALLRA